MKPVVPVTQGGGKFDPTVAIITLDGLISIAEDVTGVVEVECPGHRRGWWALIRGAKDDEGTVGGRGGCKTDGTLSKVAG